MTGPLLTALTTSPGVRVFVAEVFTVNPDNTLSLRYQGGLVAGVPRLASYLTPTVGDVVYVLSADGSMIILGREELRTVTPVVTVPPVPVLVPAVGRWVFDRVLQQWSVGAVTPLPQTATANGAWLYDPAVLAAQAGVPVGTLEIQVQLTTTSGALGLVLLGNVGAFGAFNALSPPYLARAPLGVFAWVKLPLSWATALTGGVAAGVGVTSDIYTASVTAGGTLRFTPLN